MSVVSKQDRQEPLKSEPPHLTALREELNASTYSSLSEALEEIQKRRGDDDLGRRVDHFFKSTGMPEIFGKGGAIPAVLFRQLASPNYETRRFIALAELGNLAPVIWEYLDDKFVTSNPEKYSLGKLSFYYGTGKKGGAKIERTKIVDLQSYNGKKISEVQTLWGDSLVDFHHKILLDTYKEKTKLALFDASRWFHQNGSRADQYYDLFLSFFIRDGLLFENFLLDGAEYEFTEKVFFPAFRRAQNLFGVKPLIVALEPTDIEGDEFWRSYPPEIRQLLPPLSV